MGGERGDAKAGSRLEVRCFGQRHGLLGWQDHVFGGGSKGTTPGRIPQPDALSDTLGRHAGADFIDDAGAVTVRNDLRERHDVGAKAAARFNVGGVDPGGDDSHAHLALTGMRRRANRRSSGRPWPDRFAHRLRHASRTLARARVREPFLMSGVILRSAERLACASRCVLGPVPLESGLARKVSPWPLKSRASTPQK